jgi:apolipoprotein N-acyltransferase
VGEETVQAIPSICFEDTVGRLTRKSVRAYPQVIVNITNDGWFKQSEGAAQHFANARFRCIELRRPMVRCANSGVGGVISVTGSTLDPFTREDRRLVDDSGSHFTKGTLFASVWIPRESGFTLYALWGDWFAVVGLALSFLAGIALRLRKS